MNCHRSPGQMSDPVIMCLLLPRTYDEDHSQPCLRSKSLECHIA